MNIDATEKDPEASKQIMDKGLVASRTNARTRGIFHPVSTVRHSDSSPALLVFKSNIVFDHVKIETKPEPDHSYYSYICFNEDTCITFKGRALLPMLDGKQIVDFEGFKVEFSQSDEDSH